MLEWELVAESLDLSQVMDELGIRVSDTTKGWLMSSCPLPSHPGADANPSFGINEESMGYNCFVCGGGSLPKLIIEIEGLTDGDGESNTAWQQALRWLSQFSDASTNLEYDPEFVEKQKAIMAERSEKPKRLRRQPLPIFSDSILRKWEPASLDLLAKWNITKESTVEEFHLRYNPEHERHDYVGPALIIPHLWEEELVGYQERWLDNDRPKKIAKYTNTNNFPKKETLFHWDPVIRSMRQGNDEPVLVVESAMTVVRLWDFGMIPALATFGGSFSNQQIAYLGSLPNLVLCFDNDVAGKRAVKALELSLGEYTNVQVLPAPEGAKADLADLDDEALGSLLATV